ncbi:pyruvate, water dikinase regulatory protein [Aneurinibacillus terranovensis]|uniref:pyruvate, water dikinase regulatory protein n=1 Tax=Aneurinibacillus terranovensis TaxID=278991 RepID=UPI00041CF20C|nr:pyruvate, water dikinase regulatory protein [Aneurinibacillus terranovensis]
MQRLSNEAIVYVVSDSVGETAEFVVKAAASQFGGQTLHIRKFPYIEDEGTINEIILAAKESEAIIAYTIVIPSLKKHMRERAQQSGVTAIDIMSPMVNAFKDYFHIEPVNQPGLVRQLDEDYFRKVEAIEFAVKYDDGRDPRGLLRADVILIGVSRTSKTPLSMYLANKRYKVANVPLVPEVEPPEELFLVPNKKCIGLTISSDQLNMIRTERLKSLGLTSQANYANVERIKLELEYAESVMQRVGCPVINVSNKAVEETANIIIEIIKQRDM